MFLGPGLHLMCWPYSTIASRLSLRVQQLDVACETKTKDHAFVHVEVSVQYKVSIPEMAYLAYDCLADPYIQIRLYVFDVVRSQVPTMSLDDVFASRRDVAHAVHTRLCLVPRDYGYQLVQIL
jgi:regulator of protease activity HflC (stomatin/prohibitin superfamily)